MENKNNNNKDVEFVGLELSEEQLPALGKVAYSAAEDFKWLHRNVKNKASGVLDREATVTYNEMIEHVFYQILNLVQILFLHLFSF